MSHAFKKILSLIMSLAFAFPVQGFAANDTISVAVAGLNDNVSDDISNELANSISGYIHNDARFDVVGSDKVAAVLSYHADTVASSNDVIAKARELTVSARAHFMDFSNSVAIAELQKAIELLRSNGEKTFSDTGADLVDAYLTLAMVYKMTGNSNEAENCFRELLKIAPTFKLDRTEVPPSVASLFDKVVREVSSLPCGDVEVTTYPKVAEVYLNGNFIGVTPLHLKSIPVGSYILDIDTNKYARITRDVDVESGKLSRVDAKLKWLGSRSRTSAKATQVKNVTDEIDEGVRIAELLRVDKCVMVNVDQDENGSGTVTLRVIDRKFKAGLNPVVVRYDGKDSSLDERVAQSVEHIGSQLAENITADPKGTIEPNGVMTPVLISKRKKSLLKRPIFWGAIGVAVAGAVTGGVLAAMSSGGEKKTGALKVEFR